jgi:uncharacterized membrane protein (UPF0127 family)
VAVFVACVVFVAFVASCSSDDGSGADGTTPPVTHSATSAADTTPDVTEPPVTEPAGVEPEGFSTITAIVTDGDGEECEICLWLADTSEERARGLMGVTDLGDAAGMIFRFEEPTAGAFYMFQTPTPLSIAWFGADGEFVGTAEMAPCLATPAGECPLYSPDAEYEVAIEVFEGGLEPLGIGPGAHLELIEGSEADRCPQAPTP